MGRLPGHNATISSLADLKNNKEINLREFKYIEFDKKVMGTNVSIMEKK